MNYKGTVSDQNNDSVFESNLFDASILQYFISNSFFIVNPQWNKIIKSPTFKKYDNINYTSNIFQTDFPDYLVFTLNDYFKKQSKSNYFSSFFSKSDNNSQLDIICEAAAFLTTTSEILPQILLSEQFISALIHICKTTCGIPALMSLKTLSNIAENSIESSQLLLSIELLPEIFELAHCSNDPKIRAQSMFLVSSFAKYDLGDEIANTIFSFFIDYTQTTMDILNTKLRAFSFLSQHHNNLFNQSLLIDLVFELIQVECDVVNSQCFSILIGLIHYDLQSIDYLCDIGIIAKVYDILENNYTSYCIDLLEAILVGTRKYDDIVFNQNFMALYDDFFESGNNQIRFRIMNLFKISFLNSTTDILSCIYNSSIFNNVYEFICGQDLDPTFFKDIILGIGRLFTLLGDTIDASDQQEFCEILQEIEVNDDEEINRLISQFLDANDQYNFNKLFD